GVTPYFVVTYNFAIVYPLPLSPLIISSIDTFIDVKTLNGTYIHLALKRIMTVLFVFQKKSVVL
ncbi:hypothetical protein C6352_27265, partial [Bacillus thuringiensis]